MDEQRQEILESAEQLIRNAVRLLWPLCGEQVTIGILQAMAEEQSRYTTLLHTRRPLTQAAH
jgi:hypothetical protein